MALKIFFCRTKTLCNLFRFHHSYAHPGRIHIFLPSFLSSASEIGIGAKSFPFHRLFSQAVGSDPISSSTDDINEICRVLSDFRSPHHDIESALNSFSTKVSTDLVEQVLKRCKNLGVSAHRFFIWAKKLPGFSPSKESHDILIDILGSSKQFPLIWDFLSEIKEEGTHEIQPATFWNIFRAYSRANLPADAIRAFKRMDDFGLKPSIADLDHLLFTLCKRKLVKSAQEFFDNVKYEFVPSPKTYSILMTGWGDLRDSTEARKLFDEMLERGCSIDIVAYNTLLESLCRGGKPDEAYKLFREMGSHNLTPDAFTYSVFIRAACEANDIHSAIRVLDRMRRYNLVPNVFTFNSIIKLYCKNQRVDDAHLLLDEMIERGVNPDVWSYNAILAFHCDHSEVNQALKLISRIEKDSCLPDRHTYNMLLKMLVKVGRFDRAMEVWESMGERGYFASVSNYAVMIHGLCKKKGRVEDACKFFEMMIDEGLPPYHCTCTQLRDRLLGLGFWEKTRILAEKMQRSTSCSIQELSSTMKGEKTERESRKEKEEEQKPKWYENSG
ncbi:Pentatricopeptide repeat [Macleaya cordata]|uniref:Pentatricopeptide repeat n=1 Tax=Macleaya cordata TaxID=56857 RepID=A0A200QBC7_MACCD|nr:Pentatricopeptide repeat [Macleaya cordata]